MEVSSENKSVWNNILQSVEKRLNRQIFDAWFRPIQFDGCDEQDKILHIRGSQVIKDWVNTYYSENSKWVKSIMKWDILGIHKILPASLLIKPYNWITTLMRDNLKEKNANTLAIGTKDFFHQKENLDNTWDIYLIGKK